MATKAERPPLLYVELCSLLGAVMLVPALQEQGMHRLVCHTPLVAVRERRVPCVAGLREEARWLH